MLYSKPELVKLAVSIARDFQLDPALVCAHCDVRSHWDSGLAVQLFSHNQWDLYVHTGDAAGLEALHRQTLWGLMGLYGEFARTHQYKLSLPGLLDPRSNLEFGCTILSIQKPATFQIGPAEVDLLLRWNHNPQRELVALTLEKVAGYRELIERMPSELCTFPDACKILPPEYSHIEDNQLE